MSEESTQQQDGPELLAWDYQRFLRKADGIQAQLSRGFLRCKPEKWFPALAAEWLPLAHSLSIDLKVAEVKPSLSLPEGLEVGYSGSIDGEAFGLFFDRDAVRMAIDVVVPGALPEARDIVLEYVARRFISTLASTWSGSELSEVQFDNRIDPFSIEIVGAVKLSLMVNSAPATVWIGLGRKMIERLDSLWRRQVQSTNKVVEGISEVYLEIAQLAVPPSELVAYMRSGTVIDLEVPAVDSITVRVGSKPLFAVRMLNVSGRLALETLSTPPPNQVLPDGMTRVSIVFGKLSLDAHALAEYSQAGSLWDTGLTLSDTVQMVLNGEAVAQGILCTYDGRFALSVS